MNLDETLRRAFDAQAVQVQPSPDALDTIRHRISDSRLRRRITMGLASLASATVATVTAVLVGMASCAPPTTTPTPPPGGSSGPSVAPTGSTTPPVVGSDQLPVYYLSQVGQRIMLYREFRTLQLTEDSLAGRIRAAVSEMLRDNALDPDYFSAWPATATVRDVRTEGGVAIVDLGGVAINSVGAETEALSLEQLVWTATAVAADAGSPVDGVRLLVDGAARSELWGHAQTDGVLHRGDATQVQASVWLITPQEGSTVGRTFQVFLDGTVFEATAHLRVRTAAGAVVVDRSVMLSNGAPARGQATVDLTLAPGQYTVEAFYYSPADGSIQAMDDHDITVA